MLQRSFAVELIGWGSSIILLTTLIRQVQVQWRTRSSRGISKYLFAGQMAASVGFAVYSYLLKNWVFTASNVAILAVAMVGEYLYARNCSRTGEPYRLEER